MKSSRRWLAAWADGVPHLQAVTALLMHELLAYELLALGPVSVAVHLACRLGYLSDQPAYNGSLSMVWKSPSPVQMLGFSIKGHNL